MQNHRSCPLLATISLAALAFIATPLPAQDVTVTLPALFDSSNLPYKPDTPPTLLKELSPVFPKELRTTTEPGYVIVTQHLDESGKELSMRVDGTDSHYEKSTRTASSRLQNAPAQKNGDPSESLSWIGVIYNPASASEKTPDSTPRLLNVAPVFITLDQWLAFPKGPRVVRATVEIDITGAAKNPKLEKNTSFAKNVLPAIKRSLPKWRFAPARKNGQPVNATLTIAFVLQLPPSSGDIQPKVISQARPIYPNVMKRSGMVGNVLLNFIVDVDGNAREPTVIRSNNPNFEAPAIDAIFKWKFRPGLRNGMPVNTRMQITITFILSDDNGPGHTKTAYKTPQPSSEQTAKMPENLRYDVAPEPIGVIYPVYPYEMLRDGKKGEATVAVFVTSRGVVEQIAIVQETAPEFGLAALAACEYFEFTPGQFEGNPTDAVVSIRHAFESNSIFVTDEDRAMLRLEKKSPQKIVGASKLDAKPKRIVMRQPQFPLAAFAAGLTEGQAVVEFLVDTEGKVRLPRIVSSTHPSFGYRAVQTVANWRYEPPKSGGKPVVTRVRVPFIFNTKSSENTSTRFRKRGMLSSDP